MEVIIRISQDYLQAAFLLWCLSMLFAGVSWAVSAVDWWDGDPETLAEEEQPS